VTKQPIWKNKYDKMGVTAHELYMRQNQQCWLTVEVAADGSATIFCTDGEERARLCQMLNPTIECMQCTAAFVEQTIEHEINRGRPK